MSDLLGIEDYIHNDLIPKINEAYPEAMVELVYNQFEQTGGTAIPWSPLSPGRISKKRELNMPYPEKPGIAHGNLYAELRKPDVITKDNYMDLLPDTDEKPGGYKNFNEDRPFDKIGVGKKDEELIEKVIAGYISGDKVALNNKQGGSYDTTGSSGREEMEELLNRNTKTIEELVEEELKRNPYSEDLF